MNPEPRDPQPAAARPGILQWLAGEPYRVFFVLGVLWSIVGVSLWPLFYHGGMTMHPLMAHSRLMIEGFGGAFVVGFLGTAGPRMASAPKLTPVELLWFVVLHTSAMVAHLQGRHPVGDVLFAAVLVSLMVCLLIRVLCFREDPPPPQLILALAGLICGTAGAVMLAFPRLVPGLSGFRLASLLLNQGLLLPPALGIGSFVFPRILGGGFGEGATARETRWKLTCALAALVLLIGSFFLEVYSSARTGGLLRAAVCLVYLLTEVSWKKRPGQGTLALGLKLALAAGFAGIVLAAFARPDQKISTDHLLYIGGFGLLMLVVASRVLFGHGGRLAEFSQRSWPARIIVWLSLFAAMTRAVPAIAPKVTISHHQYAAALWVGIATLWLIWHRRRFREYGED